MRHLRAAARVAVLALLALAAPRPASAQADAEREVLATVQRLFDAMAARDTATMRAVFGPGARLVGIRTGADGSSRVQQLTPDQFADFLAADSRPVWTERMFDPEVRVDGTLAHVWTAYDFHFGSRFSHCGTDAIHLLRIDGKWKIMSIADTYRTAGCPDRAPPGERRP